MKYQVILVPVDFSAASNVAIQRAVEIQALGESTLILVHVVDYIPPAYIAASLPPEYTTDATMVGRARKQLQEVIDQEEVASCEQIVKVGNVKSVLSKIVTDTHADLVVMAKHSQLGLDRLTGSTTNAIVHRAHCDVLVVHGNEG